VVWSGCFPDSQDDGQAKGFEDQSPKSSMFMDSHYFYDIPVKVSGFYEFSDFLYFGEIDICRNRIFR
jgi:hypothetical protein